MLNEAHPISMARSVPEMSRVCKDISQPMGRPVILKLGIVGELFTRAANKERVKSDLLR